MDAGTMASLLMQAGYRPKGKLGPKELAQGVADLAAALASGQVAQPVAGLIGGAAAPFVGASGAADIIRDVEDRLTYRPRTEAVQRGMQAIGESGPMQAFAGAIGGLRQAAGDAGNEIAGPIGGAIGTAAPELIEQMVNRLTGGIGKAARGPVSEMTTYHGSPHKFDKFDSSKIGTGEGAQAYGHGLYLAESPEVAQSYRPKSGAPLWKGEPVASYGMDGFIEFMDGTTGHVSDAEWSAFTKAMNDDAARAGSLYTVDLPDDAVEKMLDWDAPLSQQPQSVKDALAKADASLRRFTLDGEVPILDVNDPYTKAADAYANLAQHLNGGHRMTRMGGAVDGSDKLASEYLRTLGIPGIKYLDGTSRDKGKGTRNFVVFPGEEGRLKILKRE